MKLTFRFYKKDNGNWYIAQPEFAHDIPCRRMVEGAEKMLDIASNQTNEVTLELSELPFEGADVAYLTEDLDDTCGGGMYFMPTCKGTDIQLTMKVHDLIAFVFFGLPPKIYVG